MASNKGIPQKDFNLMKTYVSQYFDDRKLLSMLKVLYRDLVKDQRLSSITRTIYLLNALEESDKLSNQNLTLLYDTINITDMLGLQRMLKDKLKSFQVPEGIKVTSFSSHRQKLMRFGLELTTSDVSNIDGVYNTPLKDYLDSWVMIRDLEHQQIIKATKMKDFIETLEQLDLHQAVSKLTEESEDITDGAEQKHNTHKHTTTTTAATTGTITKYELSSMDYSQLLVDVSKCWKRYGKISMLKVLLCDFKIGITDIQEKDSIFELFKLLRGSGKISQSNIDVIAEAAILAGLGPIEEVIKAKIPTYPAFSELEINQFSDYRQNVIEFGNKVTKPNLNTIMDLSDLDYDKQSDKWHHIFELEINNILTSKKKKSFVEILRANEMTRELEALTTY